MRPNFAIPHCFTILEEEDLIPHGVLNFPVQDDGDPSIAQLDLENPLLLAGLEDIIQEAVQEIDQHPLLVGDQSPNSFDNWQRVTNPTLTSSKVSIDSPNMVVDRGFQPNVPLQATKSNTQITTMKSPSLGKEGILERPSKDQSFMGQYPYVGLPKALFELVEEASNL